LKVFDNPGKLYKKIVRNSFVCDTNGVTEPECKAINGTWSVAGGCTGGTDENYLPSVTWFDLEIWVGDPNDVPQVAGEGVMCDASITTDCWDIIIPDGTITVYDISSKMIYLGTYGERMTENKIVIRQSFHMKATAGNIYQSDSCRFTEEFMVYQTNAPHPNNVYIPGGLVLDSIDVGDSDSVSMVAHNAQLWFDDPRIGGYGGDDGGSATFAMIGGDDDGSSICDADESEATFEMDAGTETASKLVIRHLDGSANDSFDVYVGGVLVGSYIGNQYPGQEVWVTTTFDLGTNTFTGKETITLDVTTGYPWGGCPTYGQGAVNWAKITN
jgi:hypothetical protein